MMHEVSTRSEASGSYGTRLVRLLDLDSLITNRRPDGSDQYANGGQKVGTICVHHVSYFERR